MQENACRLDKWLWAVRIFKTRTESADACKAGKVKFNGQAVKPAREIKIGDQYEISIQQLKKVVEVKEFLHNRVSAKLVSLYMTDLTPKEEYERLEMIRQYNFEKRDRGSGRPTKRERREIDSLKGDC